MNYFPKIDKWRIQRRHDGDEHLKHHRVGPKRIVLWRIVGRIKNLIILGSGHKISPEAIEDEIARNLPGAQQVVVVGNGRGYLSAIVQRI